MSINARYWAVVDLETTGLNPARHEILQVARVVVDVVERRILPRLTVNRYVLPERWATRSAEAMEVHQITRERLLAEGIARREALGELGRGLDWGKTVLAGWGVDFDAAFLRAAYQECGRVIPFSYRLIDVRSQVQLDRARQGQVEYVGLAEACDWYGVAVDTKLIHGALYDAGLTAAIVVELLRRTNAQPVG